jgi:hypothetical protein
VVVAAPGGRPEQHAGQGERPPGDGEIAAQGVGRERAGPQAEGDEGGRHSPAGDVADHDFLALSILMVGSPSEGGTMGRTIGMPSWIDRQ